MILKNFINLFSILNVSLMFVFLFLINEFIVSSDIRKKFFLFIILLFSTVAIALYYNLDGIVMMFLVSELSVILIFITMFSQLYGYTKKSNKFSTLFVFGVIFVLNLEYYNTKVLNYNNFYSYSAININDFYYIYNFFFEKQITVSIFVIFILTIYSIFFILLYFNFKKFQNSESSKIKNLILLRKQNLLHQSNYNTKIRIFQNNK
jgi:hypothetical protein